MATWKDGAAYAPVERPDGFATPMAQPLPAGAPYQAETPGPVAHPEGFAPMPEQPPLQQVGQRQAGQRDPRDAFTVASSLMTSGPEGSGAGRDPRSPFPKTAQSALDTRPPPPTGAPLAHPAPLDYPPPTGSPSGGSYPAPPSNGPYSAPPSGGLYPAPRRATGPAADPPPFRNQELQPLRTLARVAAGLCLLGFFVTGTSPFMLLVAGVIGLRTRPLTKALGYVALVSGGTGLLLQFTLSPYDFQMFVWIWGFLALGCAIGYLIYAIKGR